MASRKQIRANRRNARLSTGPRTPDGKAASSRNAVKHGLTSRRFLIRDDEREEFQELRDGLIAEYDPRGAHAWLIFEQALLAAWNLKRVARVEAELFDNDTDPLANPDLHNQLQLLMRYHARHERAFYRALKELRAAKDATHADLTDHLTRPAEHRNSRPSAAGPPDPPGPGMGTADIEEQLRIMDELGEMIANQHRQSDRPSDWMDKLRV